MSRRTIAAAMAVFVGTGALLLGSAAPAGAITPPEIPPALNILPSEATAAAVSGATTDQTMLTTYLYKFAQSPDFWSAVAARNAGTATAAQTATVASETASFAVPATASSALLKTAGGVGVAVTGFTIGTALGNSAVQLVGIDSAGTVCSQASGLAQLALGWVTGNDCGAWETSKLGAQANADVLASGYPSANTLSDTSVTSAPVVGGSIGGATAGGTYTYSRTSAGVSAPLDLLTFSESEGTTSAVVTISDQSIATWAAGYSDSLVVSFGCLSGGVVTGTVSGGRTISYPRTGAPPYTITVSKCVSGTNYGWALGRNTAGARASGVFWVWGQPQLTVSDDPSRALQCVLAYTDGTTSTGTSASFTEGSGVLPSINCPTPTSGLTVGDVKILEVGGGVTNTLYDQPTTAPYQAAPRECDSGTCLLDLQHDGVSCFQSPESCSAWFSDPNKASTYSCSYGTHAVDLSECNVYAPTFTAQARATGNYYGDPASGDTLTNPGIKGGAATGTASSNPDPSSCWGSLSWGDFNPLDWVLTPVKCALQWAFEPDPAAIEADVAGVQDAWAGTSIAQGPAFLATVLPTSVPSSCAGVPIDMDFTWPMPWSIHWKFGEACEPPLSTTAATVSAIVAFLTIGGGCYAAARYLAGVIEFTGPAGGS